MIGQPKLGWEMQQLMVVKGTQTLQVIQDFCLCSYFVLLVWINDCRTPLGRNSVAKRTSNLDMARDAKIGFSCAKKRRK